MAVTNYYTVNGQIIGEKTTGGSRIDYLTDALGSVTATVDQSANIINTYRYKPFGGLLAKTGAGADPAFQWVGTQGYRQTGKSYAEVYVRARHYTSAAGRWTTKDPLGHIDGLNGYSYVKNRPIISIDPSGKVFSIIPRKLAGGCGNVEFGVLWSIVPPVSSSGWIIQHVTLRKDAYDCLNQGSQVHASGSVWEAWRVDKGQILGAGIVWGLTCGGATGPYASGLCNDVFQIYGMPNRPSYGSSTALSEVKFMENYELAEEDHWTIFWGPTFYEALDLTGRISLTPGDIVGWREPQFGPAQLHNLYASWRCCPDGPFYDFVGSIPPCRRGFRPSDPGNTIPPKIPWPGWPPSSPFQ